VRNNLNLNECYEIFDISKNSTLNDIKKKYRILVLKYHPDKNQYENNNTTDKFIRINKAYVILSENKKNIQSFTDGFF